jgi:hypothetical protein
MCHGLTQHDKVMAMYVYVLRGRKYYQLSSEDGYIAILLLHIMGRRTSGNDVKVRPVLSGLHLFLLNEFNER